MNKRSLVTAFLMLACLALPSFAQKSKVVTKGPIVINEFKHDTGPLLREIAPLLPEFSMPSEHEIENGVNPNHPFRNNKFRPDPVLQTAENSPGLQTPNFSLEFEGLGFGDAFFCNCMPPDNDGAPGTTQYVQWINLFYAVYDKAGNRVLGPLRGNAFWSGDQGRTWKKIDTKLGVTIADGIELADGSITLVSQAGDVLISQNHGQDFQLLPGQEPLPIATIAQASDGSLLVAGLRGISRIAPPSGIVNK